VKPAKMLLLQFQLISMITKDKPQRMLDQLLVLTSSELLMSPLLQLLPTVLIKKAKVKETS